MLWHYQGKFLKNLWTASVPILYETTNIFTVIIQGQLDGACLTTPCLIRPPTSIQEDL